MGAATGDYSPSRGGARWGVRGRTVRQPGSAQASGAPPSDARYGICNSAATPNMYASVGRSPTQSVPPTRSAARAHGQRMSLLPATMAFRRCGTTTQRAKTTIQGPCVAATVSASRRLASVARNAAVAHDHRSAEHPAGSHCRHVDAGAREWPKSTSHGGELQRQLTNRSGQSRPSRRPVATDPLLHLQTAERAYLGNMNCTWARICQSAPKSGVTAL